MNIKLNIGLYIQIGVLILQIIFALLYFYKISKKEKIIKQEQKKLNDRQKEIAKEEKWLNEETGRHEEKVLRLENEIHELEQERMNILLNGNEESREAAAAYVSTLEQAYLDAETEYLGKVAAIKENIQSEQILLDKIKEDRLLAIEAVRKEKQISNEKENYSLILSDSELADIQILNNLKKSLSQPRILSMLIWNQYYQPLAKKKFAEILGSKTICGIYKITNQQTGECYIGQSVDVDKRFKEHLKCGLGIDTPIGNKLYKAMNQYGIQNFTFELIREADKKDLDKLEQYYISLYQADKYGYNGRVQIRGKK